MKFKKEDFRAMVKNEIKRMLDDDMLRDPPTLGDPNYLKYNSKDEECPTCTAEPGNCPEHDHTPSEEYDTRSCSETSKAGKLTCENCGGVLFLEGDCGCGGQVSLYVPSHQAHHEDLDSTHDKPVAYMAKSQLFKLGKYAQKLESMIPDDLDLDDWMRSHIAQAADDIGEVYHKLDFQLSKEGK